MNYFIGIEVLNNYKGLWDFYFLNRGSFEWEY